MQQGDGRAAVKTTKLSPAQMAGVLTQEAAGMAALADHQTRLARMNGRASPAVATVYANAAKANRRLAETLTEHAQKLVA